MFDGANFLEFQNSRVHSQKIKVRGEGSWERDYNMPMDIYVNES
jgi:hypothetical protein